MTELNRCQCRPRHPRNTATSHCFKKNRKRIALPIGKMNLLWLRLQRWHQKMPLSSWISQPPFRKGQCEVDHGTTGTRTGERTKQHSHSSCSHYKFEYKSPRRCTISWTHNKSLKKATCEVRDCTGHFQPASQQSYAPFSFRIPNSSHFNQ